jgi:hypothetical protein
MTPVAVYTESYGAYAYSVFKEDDGNYFLVINEEPYCENGEVFHGSFMEVSAKLEEVKLAQAEPPED